MSNDSIPCSLRSGNSNAGAWINQRNAGGAENLVRDLLQTYYDPLYLRSMKKHFDRYDDAARVRLDAINAETPDAAARKPAEPTPLNAA